MTLSLVGSGDVYKRQVVAPGRHVSQGALQERCHPLSPALPILHDRRLQTVSYTHLTLPTICSV
eukprot:11874371-Prorocentrum_lima.AAC.1